ncbi:putative two-component response regulator [Oryzomicrobium terrae]|uniref:Putative two-component response regulator n=1 Tax=Oryzomicrobium terrae TaxID=1735038 RepID=A0A5C1EBI7_9RHOO|nr:response regulator transcription factor [Oryzomicrobium terrae]QEL66242.1 putative two-component response regulator [Oryzomicrobium terrae]
MLKLIVIEDHALVREGLANVVRQLDDEVEVFEAGDCVLGMAIVEANPDLDLVLLDLALPGVEGMSCLTMFRERFPALPVVIVSAYDDTHTVTRALKVGASGFVPKSYSSEALLAALRLVLEGQIFTPSRAPLQRPLVDAPPGQVGKDASPADYGLTERQAEVLGLMARGKSNRDIAQILGLSEGTVKIHITAIFKALGVSSRTQALVTASRYGIQL